MTENMRIVSVTDGIIIDASNLQNYLRRYVNSVAGKATKGRISDEMTAEWASKGFPVVPDTYGSDQKRKVAAKITATKDERMMARLWAIDTGAHEVGARGRIADEVVLAWQAAGSPYYETRDEYGRITVNLRTKSGNWATKETELVGFKGEDKLSGSMAIRIVTAALMEAELSLDDVRIIRVESATGRKWTTSYGKDGIEFHPVTVVSELLAQFGTVIPETDETD